MRSSFSMTMLSKRPLISLFTLNHLGDALIRKQGFCSVPRSSKVNSERQDISLM